MPQTGATVSGGERTAAAEPRAPRNGANPPRAPRTAAAESRAARTANRPTPHVSRSADGGVPGRRTVTIRGQAPERYPARRADGSRHPRPERRHQRRYERAGFRPDRAALWAFLLGVMLILAAVTSAHAATL